MQVDINERGAEQSLDIFHQFWEGIQDTMSGGMNVGGRPSPGSAMGQMSGAGNFTDRLSALLGG